MYKLDLHTHSSASPDGGLTAKQYQNALSTGVVDYMAITDHNRIDLAQELHIFHGDKIIVGEEIMTIQGEIIGLFLSKKIEPGQTVAQTINAIKEQGGLVYIPHPFETVRKGLHPAVVEEVVEHIDIIEVYNGRAFAQDRSKQAVIWAKMNRIIGVASSDAHGVRGLGKTYTQISDIPTKDNLLELLVGAIPMAERPSVRSLLYPKYNRLKKKIRKIV